MTFKGTATLGFFCPESCIWKNGLSVLEPFGGLGDRVYALWYVQVSFLVTWVGRGTPYKVLG